MSEATLREIAARLASIQTLLGESRKQFYSRHELRERWGCGTIMVQSVLRQAGIPNTQVRVAVDDVLRADRFVNWRKENEQHP